MRRVPRATPINRANFLEGGEIPILCLQKGSQHKQTRAKTALVGNNWRRIEAQVIKVRLLQADAQRVSRAKNRQAIPRALAPNRAETLPEVVMLRERQLAREVVVQGLPRLTLRVVLTPLPQAEPEAVPGISIVF